MQHVAHVCHFTLIHSDASSSPHDCMHATSWTGRIRWPAGAVIFLFAAVSRLIVGTALYYALSLILKLLTNHLLLRYRMPGARPSSHWQHDLCQYQGVVVDCSPDIHVTILVQLQDPHSCFYCIQAFLRVNCN